MATWQLQEAKAKLSELIGAAETHGPQIITQRGVETAVVIPIKEWNASRHRLRKNVTVETESQQREHFLRFLQSAPDFEIPDRHRERLAERRAAK